MADITNSWDFMVVLVCVIYNLSILAGTAYLVAERGWSGWWFLLAVLILANAKTGSFANASST